MCEVPAPTNHRTVERTGVSVSLTAGGARSAASCLLLVSMTREASARLQFALPPKQQAAVRASPPRITSLYRPGNHAREGQPPRAAPTISRQLRDPRREWKHLWRSRSLPPVGSHDTTLVVRERGDRLSLVMILTIRYLPWQPCALQMPLRRNTPTLSKPPTQSLGASIKLAQNVGGGPREVSLYIGKLWLMGSYSHR